MYSYIKGELVEIAEDLIVVEANNIGYNIHVPGQVLSYLPERGSEVKIYTYLYIREDAMMLYGFLTRDDLNVFKMLLGVSGIGPKGALAILSVCTPQGLAMAVITGDEKALIAAPGVGKKIAQRIILELKDKLAKEQQESGMPVVSGIVAGEKNKAAEAAAALAVLGYTQQDIAVAMKGIDAETLPLEEIVRQSLKKMVK